MTLDQIVEAIAIAAGDFAFDADESDITGNIEILNLRSSVVADVERCDHLVRERIAHFHNGRTSRAIPDFQDVAFRRPGIAEPSQCITVSWVGGTGIRYRNHFCGGGLGRSWRWRIS